jgi:hypothetical protein
MSGNRILFALAFTTLVCGLFGFGQQAQATPQVLALLETGGTVPMRCDDAGCRAELVSMCLQPERPLPLTGRRYQVTEAGHIRVVGRDHSGRAATKLVPDGVHLSSSNSHITVLIDLPADWVAQHFAAVDGVQITRTNALVPMSIGGEGTDLSADEIADVKRVALGIARKLFSGDPRRVTAARIANHMINTLPTDIITTEEAVMEGAWADAISDLSVDVSTPERRWLARLDSDYCRLSARRGSAPSARDCLAERRDLALKGLHSDFRERLATGW